MTHPADPIEPGQIAYEFRFPVRGLRAEADEWSMLTDSVKQVWARVEAACGPTPAGPAEHVTEHMVEAACRAAAAHEWPSADLDMQIRSPRGQGGTCAIWESYRWLIEPALKAALAAARQVAGGGRA